MAAMRLEPWWNATSTLTPGDSLMGRVGCDAAVVGGGIAGLHAALNLAERGLDVAVIEKDYCGAGASGKSSGFLTPDSELELRQLVRRFGSADARTLWDVALAGVALIADTAGRYGISCDLERQDSLFVGIGRRGASKVVEEAESHESLGYAHTLYPAESLRTVNPGGYEAGVRYAGTWTMDPLKYCQGLKAVLRARGVRVFENSKAERVDGSTVRTARGSVTARHVIVCINNMKRTFSRRAFAKTFHAQTFLAVTEPLTRDQVALLFPEDRLQVWDSNLIYSYYRLTKDQRLLLGGGLALTTFAPELHSPFAINRVIHGFLKRFPRLRDIRFLQYWPGFIDITEDLFPIADLDPHNQAVQYVLGCAGLPWAAWCGDHVAKRAAGAPTEDFGRFFGFDRETLIPAKLQRVIGKPISFALDYFYAKYGQTAD
jgi:gamma-glutamylputrescine oxidase